MFNSEQYGWWFSTEENTYDPLTESHYCKGYETTINFIRDVFQKQVCSLTSMVSGINVPSNVPLADIISYFAACRVRLMVSIVYFVCNFVLGVIVLK